MNQEANPNQARNPGRFRRFFDQMRRSFRRRRVAVAEEQWAVDLGRRGRDGGRGAGGAGGGVIPAQHVPIVEEEEVEEEGEEDIFEEDIVDDFDDDDVFEMNRFDNPFRPPRVEPVVQDVIIPPHANLNYSLWMTRDIIHWLLLFTQNETVLDVIIEQRISGMQLYYCFLDPETSPEWCEVYGISRGAAMRIKMVLGRVHNIFYGYQE